MSFIKKLNNIIPSWLLIKKLVEQKTIRISAIALTTVPVLVRISAAIQDDKAWVVLGLDYDASLIPLNLIRVFWAAITILIANLIYSFGCPKVISRYKNWSDWSTNDDDAIRMIMTEDKSVTDVIYKREIELKSDSYHIVRAGICFMYIVAGYLMLRVAIGQIYLVFSVSDIIPIFFN